MRERFLGSINYTVPHAKRQSIIAVSKAQSEYWIKHATTAFSQDLHYIQLWNLKKA